MDVPILGATTHWVCPNCPMEQFSGPGRQNLFHNCAGLKGLTAPMVPKGTDCKVTAVERGDYVGKEVVTEDGEGRPVMAVETVYADGRNDVAVFAPCASTNVRAD